MSLETELKLSLPETAVDSLNNLSCWDSWSVTGPEILQLGNTYFDTQDSQLNRAKVALRIRTINDKYIQTLKTKGESINGLTRRGEWEWPLEKPELDDQRLAPVWPEALQGVLTDQLQPRFSTDFQRTRWLVQWHSPDARVEIALDTGQVKAGSRTSPICELELELIEGDEAALHAIADQLRQSLPLTPCDKSKAERGFELLEHGSRAE